MTALVTRDSRDNCDTRNAVGNPYTLRSERSRPLRNPASASLLVATSPSLSAIHNYLVRLCGVSSTPIIYWKSLDNLASRGELASSSARELDKKKAREWTSYIDRWSLSYVESTATTSGVFWCRVVGGCIPGVTIGYIFGKAVAMPQGFYLTAAASLACGHGRQHHRRLGRDQQSTKRPIPER